MKKYILKIVIVLFGIIFFYQNFVYADMIVTPIETGMMTTFLSIPFLVTALGMLVIIYFIFLHDTKKRGNISQEQIMEEKNKIVKVVKIVLIVWILGVTFFSIFFAWIENHSKDETKDLRMKIDEKEIMHFNIRLEQYEGKKVRASIVKALIDKVASREFSVSFENYGIIMEIEFVQKTPVEKTIYMSSSLNNITNENVKIDKMYSVYFEYNEEGLINKIKIEEIP